VPQRNRLIRITQRQVNDRFEPEFEGIGFEAGERAAGEPQPRDGENEEYLMVVTAG
jgi:hypothetical protein